MTGRLFHIAARADWSEAQPLGRYAPAGYLTEGFVHLSGIDQVLRPANLLYRGRDDLVLLEIDPGRLRSEVVFEPGSHGETELFPHLYGPIDNDAVIDVIDFPVGPDGRFELPAELC